MFKRLGFLVVAMGLCACSSTVNTTRPSYQHEIALEQSQDLALHVQECQDQAESCVLDEVFNWNSACNVEARYCDLRIWLQAVQHSCERTYRQCLIK